MRSNKSVYNRHTADTESDFMLDGDEYQRDEEIGKGSYVRATKFFSATIDNEVVVLKPRGSHQDTDDIDIKIASEEELLRKIRFYKEYYGSCTLFPNADNPLDYRLIVPLISGFKYSEFQKGTLIDFYTLAMAAINEVIRLHSKDLVFIDLNANNIHYDLNDARAYLIDGGTSTLVGEPGPLSLAINRYDLEDAMKKYPQIAPECWIVKDSWETVAHIDVQRRPLGQFSMDVWSIGQLLKHIWKTYGLPDNQWDQIIEQCCNPNPNARPSMLELKGNLELVLLYLQYPEREQLQKLCLDLESIVINFSPTIDVIELIEQAENIRALLEEKSTEIQDIEYDLQSFDEFTKAIAKLNSLHLELTDKLAACLNTKRAEDALSGMRICYDNALTIGEIIHRKSIYKTALESIAHHCSYTLLNKDHIMDVVAELSERIEREAQAQLEVLENENSMCSSMCF